MTGIVFGLNQVPNIPEVHSWFIFLILYLMYIVGFFVLLFSIKKAKNKIALFFLLLFWINSPLIWIPLTKKYIHFVMYGEFNNFMKKHNIDNDFLKQVLLNLKKSENNYPSLQYKEDKIVLIVYKKPTKLEEIEKDINKNLKNKFPNNVLVIFYKKEPYNEYNAILVVTKNKEIKKEISVNDLTYKFRCPPECIASKLSELVYKEILTIE